MSKLSPDQADASSEPATQPEALASDTSNAPVQASDPGSDPGPAAAAAPLASAQTSPLTTTPATTPASDDSRKASEADGIARPDALADSDVSATGNAAMATALASSAGPGTAAQPESTTGTSAAPLVVDRASLDKLGAEAAQLSHKHSNKLQKLHKRLNKLRQAIGEDQAELRDLADALQTAVKDLLARNREHQQQLHDKTVALMTSLKQALEDGKSDAALPTWDKIQGNINNTSGKIRDQLQELTAPFKGQLNELRDWKIFAATEKKRELISRIGELVNSELAPQQLNRQIGNLHKEWKALGRSNDNDKLWAEFKALSDKAYEPCKEYFKQRKQLMADNLQQRRALCDQLETELAKIDPESVEVGEINKLLADIDKAWKKYAPVEQAKIKTLQQRYYGLINQFRKLRKSSTRDNAARKQALVAEAVRLAGLDDNRQAMQEAKRLQREWKEIGPSGFKEDKKYWAEFRKACDQIFAQRDQESTARKAQQQQAETELRGLLDKLDQHLALDDAAFRDARSDFNDLARQFNATLNADGRGARKKLVERFNDLKRRIDGRYRALPDKKTQALIEQLETLLQQLEPAEQALLAPGSDATESQAVDAAAWQVLDAMDDPALSSRLARRRNGLAAPASLAQQAAAAEQELRRLCIKAEIRAGADSPQADQSTRMQIQLEQLQKGFGQSRPTAQENLRYAQHTEMLARCIGPLDAQQRAGLQARLQQVLQRLGHVGSGRG